GVQTAGHELAAGYSKHELLAALDELHHVGLMRHRGSVYQAPGLGGHAGASCGRSWRRVNCGRLRPVTCRGHQPRAVAEPFAGGPTEKVTRHGKVSPVASF